MPRKIKVTVNNKDYDVGVTELGGGKLKLELEGESYEVDTKEEETTSEQKTDSVEIESSENVIKAPMPGTVLGINEKPGDKVKKGDPVVTLIAMKMENKITSPKKGKVKEIKVKEGQNVESGDVLVVLE